MCLLQEVEKKIADLEEQIKKHGGYIGEINQAMDKLVNDKNTSTTALNILNGAIQAYHDMRNSLKDAYPSASSEPTASE